MPVDGLGRPQVHARLDDGIAITLRTQAALDRAENLIIAQCERGHVMAAQVTNRNRFHTTTLYLKMYQMCYTDLAINRPAHRC